MDINDAGNKKPSAEVKSRSAWRWFIWWKVDQEELNKQIAEYHSLNITQSAKGQSFLLLIFSACIVTLLIFFAGWSIDGFVDVFVCLLLGFFAYKGNKWAIVGAMVYISLSKAYLVFEGFQISDKSSSTPIIHLVWWAIFMTPLYLAYKVEQARANREPSSKLTEVTTRTKIGDLDKLEKLAELKDKGIITEEEFLTKKRQILGL